MLTLEFPNIGHKKAFEELKQKRSGFQVSKESDSLFRHETFEEFLSEKEADVKGREGLVPATFFFLMREGNIVGHIQIRHHIDHPNLREFGGHIGYAIVPWERGKGYAKEQLRLALIEAKKLGLMEVMISCLSENIVSAKVIESQGGKFFSEIVLENPPAGREQDRGKKLKRFSIKL